MLARLVTFVRTHDPGLTALKRATRAAVVMPTAFALGSVVIGQPQVALFAPFGAFALLLLVNIPGTTAVMLRGYGSLIIAAVPLIIVGTLCSNQAVLAVAGMAVAAFVILFAGVISPTAALGSSYLLLAFVLPVSVPAPASEIPARLAGWALAAALGLPAVLLVWPRPWFDSRRAVLAGATRQLAELIQAHADGHRDPSAWAAVRQALAELRRGFAATPYPPTGVAPAQVALARMVSRVEWADVLAVVMPAEQGLALDPPALRKLNGATARALRGVTAVIGDGASSQPPQAAADELARALTELHQDRRAAYTWAVDRLVREVDSDPARPAADALAFLGPAFRARTLGLATEELGVLALRSAGFAAPALDSPVSQVAPAGRTGPAALARSIWSLAAPHLTVRSVWMRNSLRGAVGLAAAVAVARLTGVAHGFWVVLGTMSVLRSNALGTGETAARAAAGTVVGFVAGTVIMLGLGSHTTALWFILPVAVLFAGAAPAVISFAAGQAGFTVVVIILFNILVPAGWRVGLVRLEDVGLGCAVSVGVGLLLWPRGAAAAFGQALCDAYRAGSRYLLAAVDRLISPGLTIGVQQQADQAAAAHHRLEDAYRQFLSERGAKVIGLETATHLLTGASRLRLAAQSLATVAAHPEARPMAPAAATAADGLRRAFQRADTWYDGFAAALTGEQAELPPVGSDGELRPELAHAFSLASAARDIPTVRMLMRLLWAGEYLDDEHAAQRDLAGAARTLAAQAHRGPVADPAVIPK
ncbi:MAG TPA: FUSC family protein [Streptosporangiaceae bacterium]|nr:FUSC family protein [Streptosporangiaceae bacterium]